MDRIIHETFELEASAGSVIRGDVRIGDGDSAAPVVVICHGFKGFKDWGFFPYLAQQLALAGCAAVSMNFSHNGIGEDLETFSELDRFEKNSLALEIEDLSQLVDRIVDRNLPLAEKFDVTSIGLLGHSRGGSAVLCVGAESDAVSSVATLASIARPPAVSAEEERAWREAGVHYILNSRTDQQMPLGLGLLDDFRANPDRIEQCVRRLNKPLLIIHGSDDTTVPATAAQEIDSWAPNSELVVLDGADHTFGVGHPFKGASPDCAQVIDCLIRFFEA